MLQGRPGYQFSWPRPAKTPADGGTSVIESATMTDTNRDATALVNSRDVGETGDELPPQVAVTTAAMTVQMKRAPLDFTTRALLTAMLTKTPIRLLAGLRCLARGDLRLKLKNGSSPHRGRSRPVQRQRDNALGGPLERSGFPPPAGRVTPPFCGLFLLRRSQIGRRWLRVERTMARIAHQTLSVTVGVRAESDGPQRTLDANDGGSV